MKSIFFVVVMSVFGFLTSSGQAAECGGANGLHKALLAHDKARIAFRWKMQTGYIRSAKRGELAVARNRNKYLYAGPARSLSAIQFHLKSLDRRGSTYALVYDPRGNTQCVWLVGPNSIADARRRFVEDDGSDLKVLASGFRQMLNVTARAAQRLPVPRGTRSLAGSDLGALPGSDGAVPKLLRSAVIPDRLMAKIEQSAKTLLVLPAADLSAVPFAALPSLDGRRSLVEFSAAMVLPSVDALFFWVKMARIRRRAPMLVVGDPDLRNDPNFKFVPLPGAKAEAIEVGKMLKSKPLIGSLATHSAVVERLKHRPRLIYLATHGVANAKNPMDASFLALSGQHLYAAEIKKLSYRDQHPLVVMSACQTGLGKTFNAGVFGLARAWIHAGAAQVVASQWNVDDAATAHLMSAYIKNLRSGKISRAALRSAMLSARKKYPDPALWGSFNLFGYPQPRT